MTAEIAIMNKEAVAIAADSAVTISEEKGEKVFTSANKIFMLSKYQPVGIMVYGSANFMGIPWETIIKIYRSKLGNKRFDSLEKYAQDFIKFLSKDKRLFPESEQEKHFKSNVYSYFLLMKEQIEDELNSLISQKKVITEEEIGDITCKTIKKHHNIWNETRLLPSIPESQLEKLKKKYDYIIDDAKKKIFEKLPISRVVSEYLSEIAVSLFVKRIPEGISYSGFSGVVISGFGTEDIFPSLRSFAVEGIVNNTLKYYFDEDKSYEITFEKNAVIIPFAQSQMVAAFMEGVDPGYEMVIGKFLFQIFMQFPNILVEGVKNLDGGMKNEIAKKLEKISKKEFEKYKRKLDDHRRTEYIEPVLKVVAMLPKDEIASMAEALVNLTSFKQRLSIGTETVGGPIDVAVITKGDGFVWIKRKHYFKSDINPQFMANYYMEVESEKREKKK